MEAVKVRGSNNIGFWLHIAHLNFKSLPHKLLVLIDIDDKSEFLEEFSEQQLDINTGVIPILIIFFNSNC